MRPDLLAIFNRRDKAAPSRLKAELQTPDSGMSDYQYCGVINLAFDGGFPKLSDRFSNYARELF